MRLFQRALCGARPRGTRRTNRAERTTKRGGVHEPCDIGFLLLHGKSRWLLRTSSQTGKQEARRPRAAHRRSPHTHHIPFTAPITPQGHAWLRLITFKRKAPSKLRKERRPCSARWRCSTSARRRDETSIGTSVSPQPAVIPSPQATRNPSHTASYARHYRLCL